MSSGDACAALSDDIARAVHPDFRALDDHGADVKSTADAMLARLDELGAMLGTLRAEGREQREALEPVLEAFAEGLARDFAYVDSVEDTVAAIEAAVADTERQLASLEQSSFRRARLADVEAARRGIENLFKRVGGVTANLSRTGGSIVGGFSDATRTAGNAVKHATEKAQVSATGAVARARAKAAAVKGGARGRRRRSRRGVVLGRSRRLAASRRGCGVGERRGDALGERQQGVRAREERGGGGGGGRRQGEHPDVGEIVAKDTKVV